MTVTIRELVKYFIKEKAAQIKMTEENTINSFTLVMRLCTNNNVTIVTDMDAVSNKLKNNSYRNFNFDIVSGDYKVPNEMWKYGRKWTINNTILATFNRVPERLVNQFISLNGDIDFEEYKVGIAKLWNRINDSIKRTYEGSNLKMEKKEWEIKKLPNNFWNEETGKEAVDYIVKEKLE